MRKVERPLGKGRRRDSKKPSLMVKKDGMILEKRVDSVRNQNPFSILLRKISVFRRNAPIDT